MKRTSMHAIREVKKLETQQAPLRKNGNGKVGKAAPIKNSHVWRAIVEIQSSMTSLSNEMNSINRDHVLSFYTIQTFAPEPYRLLKPLLITVKYENDEYVAHYADANLSAAGDTAYESIENLKQLMLTVYDNLTSYDPKKLGPAPRRQKTVLMEYINKK